MRRFALAMLATASLTGGASADSPPVDLKELIKTIKSVGPEGMNNVKVAEASALLSSTNGSGGSGCFIAGKTGDEAWCPRQKEHPAGCLSGLIRV